ncbi:MAG: hypothetical protein ACR2H1_09795 [Limisphaerales bacterium]
MTQANVIALTPCFSWVFCANERLQPFQRFSPSAKTVETVVRSKVTFNTQLKQGVNEIQQITETSLEKHLGFLHRSFISKFVRSNL